MCVSPKPVKTRFLSNSHPMPPAPTMSTRDFLASVSGDTPSNSGSDDMVGKSGFRQTLRLTR